MFARLIVLPVPQLNLHHACNAPHAVSQAHPPVETGHLQRQMLTLLQAIELDGAAALPHIAACTSMGRLALLSDNKTKVKLAHDAREEAVMALALEPSNDLAHHLMGRWHYEMANLNVVVRTLVRVMYGTALASGMPVPSCCAGQSGAVQCGVIATFAAVKSILHWLDQLQKSVV